MNYLRLLGIAVLFVFVGLGTVGGCGGSGGGGNGERDVVVERNRYVTYIMLQNQIITSLSLIAPPLIMIISGILLSNYTQTVLT